MRITKIITTVLLLWATPYLHADPPGSDVTLSPVDCEEGLECTRVVGWSRGNHELDCTVIKPSETTTNSSADLNPVIAWANGWDQGNVVGQCTSLGYLPGLQKWALDGPYIVVAANQWSTRDVDVLACLQWVVDNEPTADGEWTGIAGHSQGGGAVIKAGAGKPDIKASIAMNPYGPGWNDSGNQDGPLMLLGGTHDTTTPVSSFIAVWEAIQKNKGGVLAVLDAGTHNSDAWGVDENGTTLDCYGAAEKDFGNFQEVTELWWQKHLNGNARSGRTMKRILDKSPWDTDYAFTENFNL
jgi:dienelactone hydrolase